MMPTLQPEDNKSLDAINRRLWAWVEGEYHRNPHLGLEGATPAGRWASHSEDVRLPPDDLSELFLFEQKRRVQADRTVSLDGIAYEVDATLVAEMVVLRYDPSRPREQRTVQIWRRGKQIQIARRVDVYANCYVKRDHGTKALHPSEPAESPQNGLRLSGFGEETEAPRSPSADDEKLF